MDQRIAVHAFESRRDPQCIARVGVEQRGTFHDQQGPQPLAAIEDAVPHCGEQAGRTNDLAGTGARRQQAGRASFRPSAARAASTISNWEASAADIVASLYGKSLGGQGC